MARSIEHNLFPDLSPRAELVEKIGLIEKNWLEGVQVRRPVEFFAVADRFHFFRLKGIQADWDKGSEKVVPHTFSHSLFSALHGLSAPLVYLFQWAGGTASVFLGTDPGNRDALCGLLQGFVGDPLLSREESRTVLFQGGARSHAVAMTGIPVMAKAKEESRTGRVHTGPGLDPVVEGLFGSDWAYVVQAFPISEPQADQWIQSCLREMKDIQEGFLLRDVQKANRTAVHYAQLLDRSLKRLTTGKQQGLWQTGAYLFAMDDRAAIKGAALLKSVFSSAASTIEPIRCHACQENGTVSPFINCHHSQELGLLISLPQKERPGFRLHERPAFDADVVSCPDDREAVHVGAVLADEQVQASAVSVPLQDLSKHTLVAGVTGSGKTNTIFHLLEQTYDRHGIPFLVIEPAKSEYRNLLHAMPDLRVFTLGDERPGLSSPFRFNPFAFPQGVALQTHMDFLKAVFDAAFVMYAPMPYVLEECIHRVYEDKGWNLTASSNPRGQGDHSFPTLSDLYDKIGDVVERMGYQDRTTMDIRAALQTRIRNLTLGGKGMMLNSRRSIPFEEIMAHPTVLELRYLGNDEEKAFMMGLILMAIWESHEASQGDAGPKRQGLVHLTVVEEAHRLLKNVPTERVSEEMSNVKGKGVETFCNLLAELRATGEGIVVADQIPSRLAPDVIKNTNLKVLHRMVAREDRVAMAGAMNISELQQRHVVRLATGDAVCFCEGMDRPVRVRAPLTMSGAGGQSVAQQALCEHMRKDFWEDHRALLDRFPACPRCGLYEKPSCWTVRNRVDDFKAQSPWEERLVRAFLPALIDPGPARPMDADLAAGVREEDRYCAMAQAIRDYVEAKGQYHGWAFSDMEALIADCDGRIQDGSFLEVLAVHCRERKDAFSFGVCKGFCPSPCVYGFEMGIVAKDPILHRRMEDLLDGPEYGPAFFKELTALLFRTLGEWLPEDLANRCSIPAGCLLIQKMNEMGLSTGLQGAIMGEFGKILKQLEG